MIRYPRKDVNSETSRQEPRAETIVLKKMRKNPKNTSLQQCANRRWQIFIFVCIAFILSLLQWTHLLNTMEVSSPNEHKNHIPPASLFPPLHDASFSACLLLQDDGSDRLSEWLAYHYTAASLRHLIVAEDPHSTTSALPLLERWNRTTEMEILLWKDAHYMSKGEKLKKKVHQISTRNLKFGNKTEGEMSMVRQEETTGNGRCYLLSTNT